ncbi:hypothetical protein ACFXB3_12770 [Streptomyces sp. NPDC059447]|uniref:hypothetical protein n=1 Tax=Streptomyces sp. NPDC059447 TaxID=3346834 RepID=UPI0036AA6BB2
MNKQMGFFRWWGKEIDDALNKPGGTWFDFFFALLAPPGLVLFVGGIIVGGVIKAWEGLTS